MESHQELWGGVLAQAINDAYGAVSDRYPSKVSRNRDGAIAWIESQSKEPCSFNWTCESLGLEPEYVRAQIRELLRKDHATKGRPVVGIREAVLEIRDRLKLNQRDFSRMVGSSPSAMSMLERGKTKILRRPGRLLSVLEENGYGNLVADHR